MKHLISKSCSLEHNSKNILRNVWVFPLKIKEKILVKKKKSYSEGILTLKRGLRPHVHLSIFFPEVSVTTGLMRRYPDPTEVAQAVQLLQDGTSIGAIARRFDVSQHSLKSMEEIPGDRQLL